MVVAEVAVVFDVDVTNTISNTSIYESSIFRRLLTERIVQN